MRQTLHLEGIGQIPISAAEGSPTPVRLTGRQGMALLRTLERYRTAIEQQAEAERDQEFGRGPAEYPGEVPQKIKKGDARIGMQAVSLTNNYGRVIRGTVTVVLYYSNGVEQLEITKEVYAQDSDLPGHAVAWVHVDDVDLTENLNS